MRNRAKRSCRSQFPDTRVRTYLIRLVIILVIAFVFEEVIVAILPQENIVYFPGYATPHRYGLRVFRFNFQMLLMVEAPILIILEEEYLSVAPNESAIHMVRDTREAVSHHSGVAGIELHVRVAPIFSPLKKYILPLLKVSAAFGLPGNPGQSLAIRRG